MAVRMNPEVKQLWIKALTSGEYGQGRGLLRDGEDKYCCLGVLCDLYLKSIGGQWKERGVDRWMFEAVPPPEASYVDESDVDLPDGVRRWAGLSDGEGRLGFVLEGFDEYDETCGYDSLIEMNDGGKTFEEIAKVIEEEF